MYGKCNVQSETRYVLLAQEVEVEVEEEEEAKMNEKITTIII